MLSSDAMVILDDFQFKRQSWQHRFQMMDKDMRKLLFTIPIRHVDHFKPINQVHIAQRPSDRWRDKILDTIWHHYQKQPYSIFYLLVKESLSKELLFESQMFFIDRVRELLGIENKIYYSSGIRKNGDKNQKLIDICKALKADRYLSGELAYRKYLEVERFKDEGIMVEVQNWRCRYPQGDISILDPLMRYGRESKRWIE